MYMQIVDVNVHFPGTHSKALPYNSFIFVEVCKSQWRCTHICVVEHRNLKWN